jgi:hypothetical protein
MSESSRIDSPFMGGAGTFDVPLGLGAIDEIVERA